jgi:hypothetical protein
VHLERPHRLHKLLPVSTLSIANYTTALQLALQFLEVQKSGKLPSSNPFSWRGDSALNDGSDNGVNLTGGLYDAGDQIKFGLPMAFTATLLSWSVLEYAPLMEQTQQLVVAMDSIRWVTDYLIKAHVSSNEFYFQVFTPTHVCFQLLLPISSVALFSMLFPQKFHFQSSSSSIARTQVPPLPELKFCTQSSSSSIAKAEVLFHCQS